MAKHTLYTRQLPEPNRQPALDKTGAHPDICSQFIIAHHGAGRYTVERMCEILQPLWEDALTQHGSIPLSNARGHLFEHNLFGSDSFVLDVEWMITYVSNRGSYTEAVEALSYALGPNRAHRRSQTINSTFDI